MNTQGKLWVAVGVMLILAVAGAASGWRIYPKGSFPHDGKAVPPNQEPRSVVLSGFVDIESGVQTLVPLQPGRVTEVLVKENQDVKAGTVLVRLEDKLAQFKLEQARADLMNAEAQLTKARVYPEQVELQISQQKDAVKAMESKQAAARFKLTQANNLFKKEFLSKEDLDAAHEQIKEVDAGVHAEKEKLKALELVDPKQDVIRAEADVRAKKAQLEQAQYAVAEHSIRAPADGRILRVNVAQGDVLGGNFQQPPLLFRPNQRLIVRIEVEQEFADAVKEGYQARVEDYIKPESSWQGKIVRLGEIFMPKRNQTGIALPMSLGQDNTRTLECVVYLDDAQHSLRIGQRVRVNISPTAK